MWRLNRLRLRWHPWRFVKKTLMGLIRSAIKLIIILAVGSYAGVIFIHLTNGFSFQTSLASGFQDARLLVTCPRDTSLQWQFIDRSQIEQVGLGVAIDMGEHVYGDICSSGALPSDLGERGKRKSEARRKGLVIPQMPVLRPESLPNLATSESLPPVRPGLSQTSAPKLEDLRIHLLELINQDRAASGLSPVTLGANPAAQRHAEEMLEHSYLSHWGLDGLKPYMRYTLAGGLNYEAENASGLDSPPKPGFNYRAISPKAELLETQRGWMASEGHRVNILNPWHKKVNLGIACNQITCAAIQQFEGDYISFHTVPTLSSGELVTAGSISGGFEVSGLQIWYDQPPRQLSLGQLDTTTCYSHGQPVAFLRKPAPPGSYYSEFSDSYSWKPCLSPYAVSKDTQRSSPGVFIPRPFVVGMSQVPWVTASLWQVAGEQFNIRADVSEVLKNHGPGVYTMHIWGENDGEKIVLSNYSVFYEGS